MRRVALAVLACCCLGGGYWRPPQLRWLELRESWNPESTTFSGARVLRRFYSHRACERRLWPPSYVTTGDSTIFARYRCVRIRRLHP